MKLVSVAIVAFGLAPGLAEAEPYTDAKNQFTLELGAEPERVSELPKGTLLGFERNGITVALSRIDFPNRDAWRKKERHFDEVERGIVKQTASYRRIARRVFKSGAVPTMDLSFKRTRAGARETVAMRFLFFRRYTLVLSIGTRGRQARKTRRAVEKLRESFAPYFE